MKILEHHRRTLLKSLYSAERLMHLFKNTSYYSEEPSRTFLDSLWTTVETGLLPPAHLAEHLQTYLKSNAVPEEENCCGLDLTGQHFISALRMLISFIKTKKTEYLEYIPNEIEGNHINDLSIDELTKNWNKTSILVTQEIQDQADRLAIKINFLHQLKIDEQKARRTPLQHEQIQLSKTGSVEEISNQSDTIQ
jgi:hypothetical protein